MRQSETRGRVVVITGASAGIGRATARAFARDGAILALMARGVDGLEAARAEAEAAGARASVVPVDVADRESLDAAADRIERDLGPIEIWINNAMATFVCPLSAVAPEDIRRVTEVTYLGAAWGTLAALRHMRPRNRGSIVQVGSALAYRSIPLQSAYCGAKSGLRGFTDSLRSELIHERSGIHVTMVQLAAFNTPQFDWARTCMDKQPQPLPPIFEPEVAADAIRWAATHKRREVWAGFPAVKAIWGQRLIAPLLDRHLAQAAWSGQQTDEPIAAQRSDNLYAALPGDRGARGRFSNRSKARSGQLWFAKRPWATATLAVLAGLTVLGRGVLLVILAFFS